MLNSCKVRRNTRTREIDQVVIDRPFTDERANVIYNYYRSVGIPIHLGKEAMRKELEKRGYNVDLEVAGWHGSPHRFNKEILVRHKDGTTEYLVGTPEQFPTVPEGATVLREFPNGRFRLNKMGTGEGAQAFGWGLYFTDLESIARKYARMGERQKVTYKGEMYDYFDGITVHRRNREYLAVHYATNVIQEERSQQQAITELKKRLSEENKLKKRFKEQGLNYEVEYSNNKIWAIKKAITLIENDFDSFSIPEINRNLYKTTLHEGKQPSEYTWLEWDKTVSDEKIISAYKRAVEISEETESFKNYSLTTFLERKPNGNGIYTHISYLLGSAKAASLFLLENGIDGIKYPAESISRGATSDTARGFNYVVFDENAITIEEHIQFLSTPSGEVYGFVTPEGEMFLDPDIAGVNTLIHEGAHIQYKVLKTAAERGDVKAQAILNKIQELTAPAVETIFNTKKAQERSSDSMPSVDMQAEQSIIKKMPELTELANKNIQIIKDYDRYQRILQKQAEGRRVLKTDRAFLDSHPELKNPPILDFGTPSDILRSVGITNPIKISMAHINRKLVGKEAHELTLLDLQDLMRAIHNPATVNKGAKGRVQLLTNHTNSNGAPIVVVIDNNYKKNTASITTAYALNNLTKVVPETSQDVLYTNNKKLADFLSDYSESKNRGFGITLFAYPEYDSSTGTIKYTQEKTNPKIEFDTANIRKIIENTKSIINKTNVSRVDFQAGQHPTPLTEVLESPVYNQRENETDEQYKERLQEEVFARALGDNAEQYLKDLGFTAQEAKTFLQKVQEFLAEIVDWLRGKKGFQDLSVDEINRLSIREFLDRSTTSMMLGEFGSNPLGQAEGVYGEVVQNDPQKIRGLRQVVGNIIRNAARRLGISVEEYNNRHRVLYESQTVSNRQALELFNLTFQESHNDFSGEAETLNQPNTDLTKVFSNNPKIKMLGLSENNQEHQWIANYLTTTGRGKELLGRAGKNPTYGDIIKLLNEEFKETGERIKYGTDYYITDISDTYIDNQIAKAKAEVNSYNERMWEDVKRDKQKYISEQQDLQRANLTSIYLYYETAHEYPLAMKLSILDSILNNEFSYNAEKDKISRRPRTNTTISPHFTPNSIFMNKVIPHALSSKNIIHDYYYEATNFKGEKIDLSEYKDNIHSQTNRGTWYKFSEKTPGDNEKFYRMSSLSSTYPGAWCTGGSQATADDYLSNGDLYIFYSNEENNPTIQLQIDHNNEALEVGGLLQGQGVREQDFQDLDAFENSNTQFNLKDIQEYTQYSKILGKWNKKIVEYVDFTIDNLFTSVKDDLQSSRIQYIGVSGIENVSFDYSELEDGSFRINNWLSTEKYVFSSKVEMKKEIEKHILSNPNNEFTLKDGKVQVKKSRDNTRLTTEEKRTLYNAKKYYKDNTTNLKDFRDSLSKKDIAEIYEVTEDLIIDEEINLNNIEILTNAKEGTVFIKPVVLSGETLPENFTIPKGVTFVGEVGFIEATISKDFTISEGVTFGGYVSFYNANIEGNLTISEGVTFERGVSFSDADIAENLTISEGVTFEESIDFSYANIQKNLTISEGVTFERDVFFSGANIAGNFTISEGVTFGRYVIYFDVVLPEGYSIGREGNILRITYPNNEVIQYPLGTRQSEVLQQDNRGVIVRQNGRSLTIFNKNSDITTIIHEKAHEYEEVLTQQEIKVLEEWSGHKKGTVEFSEAFAKGAEKVLYDGVFGNSEVNNIFTRFAQWFRSVIENAVSYFSDINEMNQDVLDIYANMMAKTQTEAPTQDSFYRDSDFNPDGTVKESVLQEIAEERRQIEEEAKANGTWMKAPNGNPTNLNEEQWVTVRGRRFKNWFGDWQNDPQNSSKVVDENGEPMVVYHGTASRFDEFRMDKISTGTDDGLIGDLGKGFYFAKDKKISEIYSLYLLERQKNNPDIKGLRWGKLTKYLEKNSSEIPIVMSAFLNVRILEDINDLKTNDSFTSDIGGRFYSKEGYYEIVVNSPNQIKSATDNVGTFSSESNNINFQITEAQVLDTAEQLLTTDIQGVQVLEYQGSTLSYKQRVNPITNQPTNQIEIDLISVPQENRNQGHARELLRRITEIADSRGQELYLFAAPRDRTTTTEGLIKLYKEFGFESISSFLPEEMVRPARRITQRVEESLVPTETLYTEDIHGTQEYVPADSIITYYSETGEINYKRNSEGDLVMLKTVSVTPQQEESITYQQLLSIPNLSKEQALEAYKNLYSTEFYDWNNKTYECN